LGVDFFVSNCCFLFVCLFVSLIIHRTYSSLLPTAGMRSEVSISGDRPRAWLRVPRHGREAPSVGVRRHQGGVPGTPQTIVFRDSATNY